MVELGKAEELRLGAEILALRERLLVGAEGRGERETRLMVRSTRIDLFPALEFHFSVIGAEND
jgi:hypothetical protein